LPEQITSRVTARRRSKYFRITTAWARRSTIELSSSRSPASTTTSKSGATSSTQSNCGSE
jgi:hypothetical protein